MNDNRTDIELVSAPQPSLANSRKLAILSKSPPGSNEARIISGIISSLGQRHTLISFMPASKKHPKTMAKLSALINRLVAIWHCDAVILHSPLAFHFLEAIWCRACRKPLISFIWDRYPVTIDGERYNKSIRRRVFDKLENWVVRLSTKRIIPTPDFEKTTAFQPAVAIPFWYRKTPVSQDTQGSNASTRWLVHSDDAVHPVKIVFAGQINQTRALDLCLMHLDEIIDEPAVIYIASPNSFRPGSYTKLRVEHLGYLGPSDLQDLVAGSDYGLVSLNPLFDGPALPSKGFDYIVAGKPILYFGKSLPYYCSLLHELSVGIDFTNLDSLSLKSWSKKQTDFKAKQEAFQAVFELDHVRLCAEIDKILV